MVFIDSLKVVHMGDMFFNGMFPFLDVANGCDIDNWVRQLDIVLAALPGDTKIIPGHGPLASVDELKAFRQMLYDSAEIVRGPWPCPPCEGEQLHGTLRRVAPRS